MIATKQSVFLLLFSLLFAASAYCQDCSVLKKGKFKYVDNPSAWFVIDGSKHTEYLENGKYYIQSTLKWVSGCTYTMTMKKCTMPDFPYKPNDVMTVTITDIQDGIIYFTTDIKGQRGEGQVRKEK
jgi:hypothetical protein